MFISFWSTILQSWTGVQSMAEHMLSKQEARGSIPRALKHSPLPIRLCLVAGFFFSLKPFGCMYVFMCIWMYIYMHMHMWKPQLHVRCLPQPFTILLLEIRSLIKLGALSWLGCLARKPWGSSCPCCPRTTAPGFFCGFWGSRTSPQGCGVGSSLLELPLQLLLSHFTASASTARGATY